MDGAEFFPGEEDIKGAILRGWAQSHWEAGEGMADEEEVVLESDLAFGFDGAKDVFRKVFNGRKSGRKRASAGMIV